MKFSSWPYYADDERAAVDAVLASGKVNYWTGNECREFEKEFAEWTGTQYAIALANGTVALEAALKVLDLKPDDEVVISPRSFFASASSVVMSGGVPVFADVDRLTQNISAKTIEAVITSKTKAIVVVHLAGMPADMDPIMELARKYGLYVIEDCAQAHGAKYRGRSVGSIGHIGAWSFCQDKIMTTGGEGGMITTNDKDIWSRIWSYKDHGKEWTAVYDREHADGFRWLHETFGTNWRMTEMQGAIGRLQLTKMSAWTALRKKHAESIDKTVESFTVVKCLEIPDFVEHAYYKHYLFVVNEQLNDGWTRDRIVREVTAQGVPCFQGSCSEIYLEKAFDRKAMRPDRPLPVAKELGETSIMLLVHPTLTEDEIEFCCVTLKNVLAAAQKDGVGLMC